MSLLRRHDRYVLKAFWGSFGAILLFFTIITIVLHMADRLVRVVRYWQPIKDRGYDPLAVLVEYYVTFVPFIWLQVVPFAAVLAAAFALSRLTRHNELSPLVTAGVSTRRITWPILIAGVLLGMFQLGVQELLVPHLTRRNMTLERLLNRAEPDRITRVPHFVDPSGARLSVAAFRPADFRLENALVTLRHLDGRLKELRAYPELRWDEGEHAWLAEREGTLFQFPYDTGPPQRSRMPTTDEVPLEASLSLFEVSVLKNGALGLSGGQTRQLLEADPDDPRLQLRYHQSYAQAFVPLILLLLGLPYCLSVGRRSAIPGTIAVLAASAVYYGTIYVTTSLAGAGAFNPAWLGWFPVVNFGSIGLGLWLTMKS